MNNNEISSLMDMLNNMDKDQLANGMNQLNKMLNTAPSNNSNSPNASNNSSNSYSSNNSSSPNLSSLDFETITKIKSIMDKINSSDDPKSNLLYSLKPYLRDSKKAKLDQYVNLLKISEVTGLFKSNKGEQK